ncbi:rod shape-determining protein MreC [Clostridium taeniosporum]|uniref:Cell shape-determining protein MreC n=1 Tax=Clostridium taeniosporum TaxID=394958 RepID=A0A1D7XH77_9CLOT|nr:rod shape-determining protein MreC [Clostridium taeniosporum]AOR22672.1 rod shape-determining protein MreC [Clostridium taeniosporum]
MRFFKNKLAVTVIVLSVTFLSLIVYTVKRDDKTIVENGTSSAIKPAQSIVYKATSRLKETLDFFLNFSEVKDENKKLTVENEELKSKLIQYSDLEEENERLRSVVNFANQNDNYNYIGCDIIGYSGGNFLDGYIVNKGENEGIKKGMVVIAAKGLVGKVTTVGSNWSIVQSLINENIAVSVMVESTRESTGYLKGYKDNKNRNLAKVYNLPIDSQVKEGDVIITSGVGMIYPKEIKIGEVVSVEEDKIKVMKNAVVKPYVDFNKLEELFIVSPKDTREIKY